MYLSKKTYIGANYEHNNVKGEINLTRGGDNKPVKVNLNRVSYIEEEVAYWRKANAIHPYWAFFFLACPLLHFCFAWLVS